jgi:hypothetical protein
MCGKQKERLAAVSPIGVLITRPAITSLVVVSLAYESHIESRIASRGSRTPGGCQASENIAAARGNASAKLRCVSVTHAYNIVRQGNASFGKLFLVLLETFEHVVSLHWHTAALFYKCFAASYRDCSAFFRIVLRLSNIEVDGRN